MTITEPMTLATDYLLAFCTAWWGARLLSSSHPRPESRRWFAVALLAAALAAALGGTVHGFAAVLPPTLHDLFWLATLLAVGVSDLAFLFAAAAALLRGGAARWLRWGGVVKGLVFAVCIVQAPLFRYVVYDYLPTILLTLGLFVVLGRQRQAAATPGLSAGLLLTVAAAAVQRSGWPHAPFFNHNDLYHLVQLAAFWFMQRGAARLVDPPG